MGASTFDRKTYAREWARRKRARTLAAQNASSRVCQKRHGAGVCGGVLYAITDGAGHVATVCPLCEKQARGECRDCQRPVSGRVGYALRCADRAELARVTYSRRFRTRHPEQHRRAARRVYQQSAAKRRARNDYKRAWRKANRDKVKAQKRRYALRGKLREDQARHRAKHPAKPRRTPGLRTCLTPGCSIVLTGRKKKCTKCRERERIDAQTFLGSRRQAA